MKSTQIIVAVVGAFILVGLFWVFKPKSQPVQTSGSVASPVSLLEQTSTTSSQYSEARIFELTIKGKKLISGPRAIQVSEGDEVILKVTSDRAEEFHLHGYDRSVELEASGLAELKFNANLTGRFPFELEKSKTEIGSLEVLPK